MNDSNLLIQFQWETKKREILVCSTDTEEYGFHMPLYQVFRNNKYLFSIYPAIQSCEGKCWELVEKEKAELIPAGFIGLLGGMIDEYFTQA